jgi:hypothetical protein
MAIEIRNRLSTATGLRLHATVLFDFPTVDALAQTIADRLAPQIPATRFSLEAIAAELDKLESTLVALRAIEPLRAPLTGRLQTLLARWGTTHEADAVLSATIDAAGTDELLDLLEQKLGGDVNVKP